MSPATCSRRAGRKLAGEAGVLVRRSSGATRVLGAVGGGADLFGRQAKRARRRAKRQRARGVAAHARGNGRAPAQRVEHQRADGGAVARAGEAMRLAPVGERRGRRSVPVEDVVEDFRRRRDPSSGAHGLRPGDKDADGEDHPHGDERDGADADRHGARAARRCRPCGCRRARAAPARKSRPGPRRSGCWST